MSSEQADPGTCPHCGGALTGGPACASCGLRLVGPDAARLWQVQQQLVPVRRHLAALEAESEQLVQRLLQPAPAIDPVTAGEPGVNRRSDPGARRSLSGQQLLLGLGALMLLSAATFFLVIVWVVVGIWGQAVIMLSLTGAAVLGGVGAARRGMAAGAETCAVLASGFLALDLWAAHSLGLAGLDRLDGSTYWLLAGLLACALLVVVDRLTPRISRREGPGRPVLAYRPVAALMFLAAAWSLPAVALAGLSHTVGVAGGFVVMVLSLVGAWVAHRTDPAGQHRLLLSWSAWPLAISAGCAALVYLGSGISVGFDVLAPTGDRYVAFGFLAVVPLVLGLCSLPRIATAAGVPARAREAAAVAVSPVAALVLAIPAFDTPAPVWVIAALGIALALIGLWVESASSRELLGHRWRAGFVATLLALQPVVAGVVWLLTENGALTVGELRRSPGGGFADVPLPPVLVLVPFVAALVSCAVAVSRSRGAGWVWATQVALLATTGVGLEVVPGTGWQVVLAVTALLFTAQVWLAAVAAGHGDPGSGGAGVPSFFWSSVEASAMLFGVGYAVWTVAAGFAGGPDVGAAALVGVGIATWVYAAVAGPSRFPAAYLGSVAISLGTGVKMAVEQVTTIEAYSLPLAALLAAIGVVQWSRDSSLPTMLTAGPALSVAFGPTLLVALSTGDSPRLAYLTAAAVLALVVGLVQKWRAPVTIGGAALVLVAITQGGPWIAYVPGWVTLGAGGAALLAIGLLWEQAVLAGKATNAWYHTLR